MIFFLIFYAIAAVFWFCIVATVLAFYACLWIFAILLAVLYEVIWAIVRRRRLRKPKMPKKRPIPQAHWSNRR